MKESDYPKDSAPATANYQMSNWMEGLDGKVHIGELCIPGTHDSGTYKIALPAAKCQESSKTLAKQLSDGIRFFDLRIGWNGWYNESDNPRLFHGTIDCSVKLKEAIDTFCSFLEKNRSETLIVCMNDENWPSKRNFANWCLDYITPAKYQRYWYTGTTVPLLSEVRGKMVLVARKEIKKCGLNATYWPDNSSFFSSLSGPMFVQDKYTVLGDSSPLDKRADEKVKLIKEFMLNQQKYSSSHRTILLNFWNHRFTSFVSVKKYADAINDRMKNNLDIYNGRRGVQIMDFYRMDNVRAIIQANDRFRKA